jgi:lipopolysaccharide export system permease protein
MTTWRRYLYSEILRAVGFVLLAFLALFLFFDLVDDLNDIGREAFDNPDLRYGLHHVLIYIGLQTPNRIYELLPMAVLIGMVWVLARMANTSEFTILRTSGLGPWRALRMLLGLGAVFVAATFAVGDYLAPWTPMVSTIRAQQGSIENGGWVLQQVQRREFQDSQLKSNTSPLMIKNFKQLAWTTDITTEMVAVALLRPERMRTVDLFGYIQHLNNNEQSAQRYEIEFWRKVFYPLSCLVMVVLALPFAYLHARSGGVAGYVFVGVMIGISFFLLNNMFGFIGNLRQWTPWFAAGLPSLLYSVLSLSAFGWLVLRR